MDDRTKAMLILQELAKMGSSLSGNDNKKIERNYADTEADDRIVKESSSIAAMDFVKKKANREFRFAKSKELGDPDCELRQAVYALIAAEMISVTSVYESLIDVMIADGATEEESEMFLTHCLEDIKGHSDKFTSTVRLLRKEGLTPGGLKK